MNIDGIVAAGDLWVAVPIALLAGLVSFLSPCVLPLVPGYLGFIGGAVAPREPSTAAGRPSGGGGVAPGEGGMPATVVAPAPPVVAGVSRSRLVVGVLLFIAGFTFVFLSINLLGSGIGYFFLEHADVLTRVGGVVVIVLGLIFIGVFGFAQRTVKPRFTGRAGLVGAFLLGITLGIGWTPCIGPTLGVIMTLSWSGGLGRGIVLALAYSAGLGIPFLLIALGFGWAVRSVAFVRRHIRTVNVIGGSLLIALGVLMVTGVWGALMSHLQGVMLGVELPI